MASAKDYIVSIGYDTDVASNYSLTVMKMGSGGQVTRIASQIVASLNANTVTNGEWFGFYFGTELTLFQLDDLNNLVNPTVLDYNSYYYVLLEDNSIVLYDTSKQAIRTLLLNGTGQWTPLEEEIPASGVSSAPSFPSVWANNNTMVFYNVTGHVNIYSRANNGGWTFESKFQSNGTGVFSLLYNGVDALFFISPLGQWPGSTKTGYIIIYTKIDGEWVQQVILADDLPVTQPPFLGYYSYGMVRKDLAVIAATYDGYAVSGEIGSLYFMQRLADNKWTAVAKASVDNVGLFGYKTWITSTHIIAPFTDTYTESEAGPSGFYAIPICIFEPINVTCNAVVTETCDISLLDSDAFTIHSNSLCGDVAAAVESIAFADYTFNVEFSFTKSLVASTSCNANISCPAPPVAASVPVGTKATSSATNSAIVSASTVLAFAVLF